MTEQLMKREWTMGLANMLKKENSIWWSTRKWKIQAIIWTLLINGSVAMVMYIITTLPVAAKPQIIHTKGMGAAALHLFFNIAGFTSAVGIIILIYDIIIKERESGTAIWVLSKPLSRRAFVISKLTSSALAVTIIVVIMQSLILILVTYFFGGEIDLVPYFKGVGLIWIQCMFYTALVIFFGTIASTGGIVLGASCAFFLLGKLIPLLIPEAYYIMPWNLPEIAFSVALCSAWSPKIVFPVIMTIIWTGLLCFGSLRRIEKIEL